MRQTQFSYYDGGKGPFPLLTVALSQNHWPTRMGERGKGERLTQKNSASIVSITHSRQKRAQDPFPLSPIVVAYINAAYILSYINKYIYIVYIIGEIVGEIVGERPFPLQCTAKMEL